MGRASRVCSKPGCPVIVASGAGTCADHARPNANARGYNAQHRALRRRWEPRVATGQVKCWRCSQPIKHNDEWHLGHVDGTNTYGGPEHARECNLRAAGKSAHEAWRFAP